jgi:hypothetical protein
MCVLLLHCRCLVPPCQTSAAGTDTKQLQQLHARALQLCFCKVSPGIYLASNVADIGACMRSEWTAVMQRCVCSI